MSDKLNVGFIDLWRSLGVNPDARASLSVSREAGLPLPNMTERLAALGVGFRYYGVGVAFSFSADRWWFQLASNCPGGTLMRTAYILTPGLSNHISFVIRQAAYAGVKTTENDAVVKRTGLPQSPPQNTMKWGEVLTPDATGTYATVPLALDSKSDDFDWSWMYIPAGEHLNLETTQAVAGAQIVGLTWVELQEPL